VESKEAFSKESPSRIKLFRSHAAFEVVVDPFASGHIWLFVRRSLVVVFITMEANANDFQYLHADHCMQQSANERTNGERFK